MLSHHVGVLQHRCHQRKPVVQCKAIHALPPISLKTKLYAIRNSMKRTLPRPIALQLLHRLLKRLPPLPLKIPRPNIRNTIPRRIILFPLIARHGSPQQSSQPRHRTPSVPDRRLDVVRRCFPGCQEVAVVCVGLFGDGGVPQEVGAGRGQVAED